MMCLFIGLHDVEFQNKSNVVSATWHGFTDLLSGITRYWWCVGSDKTDGACDILLWTDTGMHTRVSKRLSKNMDNGIVLI